MRDSISQEYDHAEQEIKHLPPDQQSKDLLVVAKGGGVSFIGTVAVRGISYLYNAALIWGLGGDGFGLFTLGLTIITIASILTELGLDLGIVRFGAIYTNNKSQISLHKTTIVALQISLSLGLLFLIIIFLTATPLSIMVFNKPQLAPLLRAFALIIPTSSVTTLLLASIKALKIMKYSVYAWTLQQLSSLVFAIPMLILHMGVQTLALSLVASYVVTLGFAIYFYWKVVPRGQKDALSVPVGEIVKFSIPLSLTRWIQYATDRTEVVFLGLLPNVVNVGIYKIAWSLAGLETTLRLSLEQILAPFSSDLSYRKQIKQLENLYKTTAKWSFTAALLLCMIYTLFAKQILNLFDPAYVVGASVLIALSFAQLFNEATGACGTILIMSGRSDLSLLNTIVLFVSSITFDWILIPRFGLVGAAIAGALTIILVNILRVVEVWLTLKIHPFKWNFIKPAFAGLFSSTLVLSLRIFIKSETIPSIIAQLLLYFASYFAILLILKLDAEDMVVIQAMTRKITKSKASSRVNT